MTVVFWTFSALIVYVYAGYFSLMAVLAAVRARPYEKRDATPAVTLIIAAYNEEKNIAAKLDNVLELDYPTERLQVFVGSDASDDATDDIVRSYADRGVELVRVEGRLGKTAVQNECVARAAGDIVVFTDATTRLERGSLRAMMTYFGDPKVGCVGARLAYIDKSGGDVGKGGTSYWNYEALLKRWESVVNSLIGVSGCYYGIRKALYDDIDAGLISDFVVALDTYRKGYRVAYAEEACCEEETLDRAGDELEMRARVALRTYTALAGRRELLAPWQYPMFSFQLISHKVLRYLVGPFLLVVFLANLFLLDHWFYQLTFAAQIVLYGAALSAHLMQRDGGVSGLLAIPYYFVLVNVAATLALVRFLRGESVTVWTPKR